MPEPTRSKPSVEQIFQTPEMKAWLNAILGPSDSYLTTLKPGVKVVSTDPDIVVVARRGSPYFVGAPDDAYCVRLFMNAGREVYDIGFDADGRHVIIGSGWSKLQDAKGLEIARSMLTLLETTYIQLTTERESPKTTQPYPVAPVATYHSDELMNMTQARANKIFGAVNQNIFNLKAAADYEDNQIAEVFLIARDFATYLEVRADWTREEDVFGALRNIKKLMEVLAPLVNKVARWQQPPAQKESNYLYIKESVFDFLKTWFDSQLQDRPNLRTSQLVVAVNGAIGTLRVALDSFDV